MYAAGTVGRLAVAAPPQCWCPGYDLQTIETLEFLRRQPYERWSIDAFVRHTPAGRYITEWPHQGIPRRPRLVIGRSMVEIDVVDRAMVGKLAAVDAVWVPSRHSQLAFTRAGASADKFAILHEPTDTSVFDPSTVEPLPLPRLCKFNFLSVFKWEARKGVNQLVRAFFEEFSEDDDVCLVISSHLFGRRKPYNPRAILTKVRALVAQMGLNKKDRAVPLSRVIVVSEKLPTVDMRRLYRTADAFVLPTHGEGWGLPVIEAMAMGLPTIATDYSGIREFLTPEVGFPVRTLGLETAKGIDFQAWMRWAKVDAAHLREQMRRVFSMDARQRQEVGRRARQHVATHFSRAAVARQVKTHLETLMRKHDVRGSAPSVCLQEYKAERRRGRELGLLGTAALSPEAADDAGALHGGADYVREACSPQGMRRWFQKWDGLMPAQYKHWPAEEPLDADPSVPDTLLAPLVDGEGRVSDEARLRADVNAFSAFRVFTASLPPSDMSAAQVETWEARREREKLKEQTRLKSLEMRRRTLRQQALRREAMQERIKQAAQRKIATPPAAHPTASPAPTPAATPTATPPVATVATPAARVVAPRKVPQK
jgi:glycosyltransferase involved in cell wall biosynthesis